MKLLSLLLLLWAPLLYAQSPWSEACVCPTCQGEVHQVNLPNMSGPLEMAQTQAALTKLEGQIQAQVDRWGDFTRWTRGQVTKGSTLGFNERWEQTDAEIQGLMEICRERGITRRKRNYCAINCSATTRLQLDDARAALDKTQLVLLARSPWLMNEDFVAACEKAEEKEEFTLTPAARKEFFSKAMGQFFEEIFTLRGKLSLLSLELENRRSPPSSWPSLVLEKHDVALESVLGVGLPENKELCSLAEKKHDWNKLKDRASLIADVSLATLGIVLGPETLLSMGVRRAAGSWFASFGKNFAKRLGAFLPDVALTAKFLHDYENAVAQCRATGAQTSLGLASAPQWQQCLDEKDSRALTLGLQALSGSGAALPWLKQLPNLWQKSHRPSPMLSVANGEGVLSRLDLSRQSDLKKIGVEKLSDQYWRHVSDVYKDRLNLSPQEIQDFINSSRKFEARTTLITQTRGPPSNGANQFQGGVGIVHSSRSQDLLPVEKATGVKLPRDQGKIIEVVRLTAAQDQPQLMRELLIETASVVRQDPSIKRVYVYTSKVHARLYKRLGIEAKVTELDGGRDVLMEVPAETFSSALTR